MTGSIGKVGVKLVFLKCTVKASSISLLAAWMALKEFFIVVKKGDASLKGLSLSTPK